MTTDFSQLCSRETKSCLCFPRVLVEGLTRLSGGPARGCPRTNTAGLKQDGPCWARANCAKQDRKEEQWTCSQLVRLNHREPLTPDKKSDGGTQHPMSPSLRGPIDCKVPEGRGGLSEAKAGVFYSCHGDRSH